MEVRGLATCSAGERFLSETYRITRVADVGGIPTFVDATGTYFVGGYKHVYAVLTGNPSDALVAVDQWRKNVRDVRYTFSCEPDPFATERLDFILEIPRGMQRKDRLDLYERSVKKHVRNTIASSTLRYETSAPPSEWYRIYCRAMERKRTHPRPRQWFERMEQCFGEDIIAASAYDEGHLAGALYCVRSNDYMQLAIIASEYAYRARRVDSGLYDAAICFALDHGIRFVDFGPTMRADQSHALVKKHFGAREFHFADRSFTTSWRRAVNAIQEIARRTKRFSCGGFRE